MPPQTGPDTRRVLLAAARPARPWILAAAGAALAGTAAAVVAPAALAHAVDAVCAGRPVAGPTLLLAAALLVAATADGLSRLADPYCSATVTAALRRALVDRVLALGVSGRRRFDAGDLVARAVSDTTEAGGGTVAVAQAASATATAAAGLAALAVLDVRLAATFLLGVPAGLVLLRVFVRQTTVLARSYQDAQGEAATGLVDALAGIRTVAAAGTVDREVARVLGPLPRLRAAGQALWVSHGRLTGWATMLGPMVQIAVLAVAGCGVAAGWLTLGQVAAATGYLTLALGFLDQAGPLARLAQARASRARLAEVLAVPPPAAGRRRLPPGPGTLTFRGVSVQVDGVPVLAALDLDVPGGSSVAIVGASGSGKTLLTALAGRLADPDRGVVALDGVPLPELDRAALRRAVGFAFERPALLGDTVADAVGLGRPGLTRAAVHAAARAAQVDDVVRRLPAGYDTELAGAPMSGGEAQRLGIARAVAPRPRLLILDDATASLDAVTELRLAEALTGGPAGCTRLIVAHRAATAARADAVAWLDAGRIRAVAPHHTLWQQHPAYRAIFAAAEPSPEVVG
jgi:ATP-binding cassette subfamily B protein